MMITLKADITETQEQSEICDKVHQHQWISTPKELLVTQAPPSH